jgi:hypothetical protein
MPLESMKISGALSDAFLELIGDNAGPGVAGPLMNSEEASTASFLAVVTRALVCLSVPALLLPVVLWANAQPSLELRKGIWVGSGIVIGVMLAVALWLSFWAALRVGVLGVTAVLAAALAVRGRWTDEQAYLVAASAGGVLLAYLGQLGMRRWKEIRSANGWATEAHDGPSRLNAFVTLGFVTVATVLIVAGTYTLFSKPEHAAPLILVGSQFIVAAAFTSLVGFPSKLKDYFKGMSLPVATGAALSIFAAGPGLSNAAPQSLAEQVGVGAVIGLGVGLFEVVLVWALVSLSRVGLVLSGLLHVALIGTMVVLRTSTGGALRGVWGTLPGLAVGFSLGIGVSLMPRRLTLFGVVSVTLVVGLLVHFLASQFSSA